ncbi:hypothetical protein TNCV_3997581 [Trichonephila clavipes]|nr:hypothetical protein TNCV_3997581 [Trichonephila clavipes]
MRIATQTESALICKEYSSPFIVSQFRCSRHHRERLLRWAGVKGTHRTGRRANRPPPCSLLATGLGSNPGEGMDICKCIEPLQYGGTLNSCRAACSLVRLVEEEKRWEASDPPPPGRSS